MRTLAAPITAVVKSEELAEMLAHGWTPIGVFMMDIGQQQIATLDSPAAACGVQPCNVWVQAQPLMPIDIVKGGLVAVYTQEGSDKRTLDALCKGWFGKTVQEVLVESQSQAEIQQALMEQYAAQAADGVAEEVA